MNEQTTIQTNEVSFKYFMFNNDRNRIILLLAGVAIIIQFAVFKYFYPYAGFLHGDSFVYIRMAFLNLDVDMYMVGYSKFLRLVSVFTKSDTILVCVQYFLIQSSALFFLFTLLYFYRPSMPIRITLACFIILNPLFLYMANMVSSDPLFLALSLIWFALMLWIIHKPSTRLIIYHTLVIFVAFTVRYNALLYPFIASLGFILSKQSWQRKMVGITISILLCLAFILHTANNYKKLTGFWQYSPFSGWQLANNAMYAYRYVESAERKPVPKSFKALDDMIRDYFDSTRDVKKHPLEALQASTFYMWYPTLPLQTYMNRQFANDPTATETKKWSSMGPLYGDYGILIMRQYPWHFIRYFLWPNTLKYVAPPTEYLGAYNTASNYVAPIAQTWFRYKSTKVYTRTKDLQVTILNFYPLLSSIMNIIFLCSFLSFIYLKGHKNPSLFRDAILLSCILWLLNAIFSIFSTAASLRFLAFPILIMTSFGLLLIEWTWKKITTISATAPSLKPI